MLKHFDKKKILTTELLVSSIVYLECLISISNISTFKFEKIWFIPYFKLSQPVMTTMGYWRGLKMNQFDPEIYYTNVLTFLPFFGSMFCFLLLYTAGLWNKIVPGKKMYFWWKKVYFWWKKSVFLVRKNYCNLCHAGLFELLQ